MKKSVEQKRAKEKEDQFYALFTSDFSSVNYQKLQEGMPLFQVISPPSEHLLQLGGTPRGPV